MKQRILLIAALVITTATLGYQNPKAPKGGKFRIGFHAYPKALLNYLALDSVSGVVNATVLESLLEAHPQTNELIALLAESWEVSKDKKTFTFKINPNARFSDGKPVTAADVKFTWDTLHNPKHKTIVYRNYLESIESCKVIDKLSVQFKAKTVHFKNLEKVAGLYILPKHKFSKGNFNKDYNKMIWGSGPYTISKVKKNDRIEVKRNPKYWGANLAQNQGRYNFDKIVFKAIPDDNVQYEVFKKGKLDLFQFSVAKMWETQTNGPKYNNNYIVKLKGINSISVPMQAIAWNLRKPLFQDRRVRLALSLLMDRDTWNKELFFNNYRKSASVVAINSPYHDPKIKPIDFSPKKAKKLLDEAGWKKLDSDGIRKKGGQRFEFTILSSSQSMGRILTRYQEDLKKMGIKMNIRYADWATSLKLTDDRKFDGRMIARGRGIDPSDFSLSWGSDRADVKGSANLTGFKNKELDKLAAQIDQTFDKKKRIPLVQKVEAIIHREQPVSFCWEPKFFRAAYWNRFGFEGKGYAKYTNATDAIHYWWFDGKKDKALSRSVASKKPFK